VVVGPGTGDNMGAALGLGLRPGDVVISLGTSGTVFAVSDQPVADPSGAVAGFADATGRFLPLVCTLNCTKVTDWAAATLSLRTAGTDRASPHAALDDLALSAPPGAGGVVLVPYLDGERTPNRPTATGSLMGLRSSSSAADVARAAFEGVACGLLDGLDALAGAGVDTSGRLVLVGGGAESAAYRRVLADLAQRPITVPDTGDVLVPEWVATGACVQAAAVLHQRQPEEVAAAWGLGRGTEQEPDLDPGRAAEIRARYAAARG